MTLPALDPSWERWIQASIVKFVKDACSTNGYNVYVEGENRKTNLLEAFFELRVDGPKFTDRQSDYRVEVEVNVLVQLQQGRDLYKVNKMSGFACATLFPYTLAILKLGNLPGDDQSLLACLRRDAATGLIAHKYGIVQPSLPTIQASVGTKYWVDLPDEGGTPASPIIVPTQVPARQKIISRVANYAIQNEDSGTVFNTVGATGAVTFQLPPWVQGLVYVFVNSTSNSMSITTSSGDTLEVGGTSGSTAQTSQHGDSIIFAAADATGEWVAEAGSSGSWNVT